MKKLLLSLVAIAFSAQIAFANNLDDLDDIQQAIGSAIGETTANAVTSTSSAIAASVNATTAAGAASTNIAGNVAAAGVNTTPNTGAAGTNIAGNTGTAGAGLANAQQLVALSPAQLAALGIQTNTLTATANTTVTPATTGLALAATATNINGVFAAVPTASGNTSAASIASTAAAMEIADSEDFSYDNE